MNKNIYRLSVLAASLVAATSCLGDLDTLPLNQTDSTSETAYKDEASYLNGLSYINGYWMLVSQGDPGSSDLDFNDAGQSELARQYMILNELSTDELDCSWGDAYVNPIQDQTWTDVDNGAITAVYTRALKGITLCNEYLLQTTDERLAARGHNSFKQTIAGFRAEAKFHRAMYNYILMDLFGNPPFATEESIGGENPKQIQRAELFKWIENELLDLLKDGSAMPKKGEVAYPRPTQGAVAALLARMYLNAEVYTGTARWQDAKDYAKKVIDMGYSIHPKFQELFLEDNGTNGAADEFIFALDYDNVYSQSWGGTTTLSAAAFNDAMCDRLPGVLGISVTKMHPDPWNGYHVSDDYVKIYDLQSVVWGGTGLGYDRAASDQRAFFFNEGQKNTDYSRSKGDTGWRVWKWIPMDSKGHVRSAEDTDGNYKLSSTDLPIIRLAEMYLIYAEADARLNGGTTTDATALSYVKALRDRAGVSMPASVTTDWILDERAREFMWEGLRRQDLIRYGKFSSDPKRNIYPLLASDINANPNLEQNK